MKADPGLIRRAVWLSWFTVVYNILEGVVSVAFGVKDESIALAGFGLDSFIEVASAFVVLWRFKGETGLSAPLALASERRAIRVIGWLFILLAVSAGAAAAARLIQGAGPDTTVPGVVISLASLSFMFWLWRSKLAVAAGLDSATVEKDAACSLACIKLSSVLLAGSLACWVEPSLWWVDSAAALAIAFMIGREGVDTVRAAGREDFSGGCGCCSGSRKSGISL